MRWHPTFETMLLDFRYAARALRRAPGTSAAVVVTLALTLAACIAAFAVLDATLLGSLPYRDPHKVFVLSHRYNDTAGAVSPPTFADYRRETRAFASLSAAVPWNANLTGQGEPERLRGLLVSSDFFDTLGVPAALGRTFREDEEQPGRNQVVVISHGLWVRRFAADPQVVGRSLVINSEPYEVIGIAAPGFAWGRAYGREAIGELWSPFALTPARLSEQSRGDEFLDVYGRARDGVSRAQAQADLDGMIQGLRGRFPDRYTDASGFRATVVPLRDDLAAGVRGTVTLVFASVLLLLVVAGLNVASLLLARVAARRPEIAVRAALGARAGRLTAETMAEALLLAAAAAAVGLLLARAACALVETIDRVTLPRFHPVAIDPRTAMFAVAAALSLALVTGALPAWHVVRAMPASWLHGRGRTIGGGRSMRTRRLLIVAQTALAVALLAGAGLLVRSLDALSRVDTGFHPSEVLVAQVQLPRAKYPDRARRSAFVDDAIERLAGQGGVRAAAVVSELPMGETSNSSSFEIDGRPVPAALPQPHAETWSASPSYFDAMGVPFVRGRMFDQRDGAGATPVALVSESLAAAYFAGEDPIGRRIDFEGAPGKPYWRVIVGVVGDVRDRRLDRTPGPQLYAPYAQRATGGFFIVCRTASPPLSTQGVVRSTIHAIDPDLPVYGVAAMNDLVAATATQRRAGSAALLAFALAAMALAALGLYALVAHSVRDRVPEIGVRVAVGANRSDVMRLFLGDAVRLAFVSIAAGVPLAVAGSRLLRGYLFGVAAGDPATYAAVVAAIVVVFVCASVVPAWRATHVDPLTALRAE
jgi:putative ABC transport system permease protein